MGMIGLMVLVLSPGAHATPVRCQLLAPLVVSSYIALFDQVAKQQRRDIAQSVGTTGSLLEQYQRLGCPMPALIDAIECLSITIRNPARQTSLAASAERCLQTTGLVTP